MNQEAQQHRNVERLNLFLFTLYGIGIFIVSLFLSGEVWVSVFTMGDVIAGWIVFAGKYKDYYFRAKFTTCMAHISLCLLAANVDQLVNILPILATFVIISALYGMAELTSIHYVATIFMFFYHIIVKQQISVERTDEICGLLLQMLNIMCMESLVHFWLKKREDANKKFVKSIMELKEAERSKDDFLANVSHEIRTPINTICGMSELLLGEKNIEKIQQNIRYIYAAGRNLMSVVGDVLDFSELQSGKIAMEEEAYNITSTINDVVHMFIEKVEQKSIELIVDCDASIPCGLLGDEKKIRRVIMNLLDNAIKFTEEGCVCVQIGYRKEEYGINLIITVKDTGIGMKQENLERLFCSFSQVDTRRNRQNGGMGLGLAISQAIIRMLGGVITVKSKYSKGTSVKFVVPQKVLDERAIAHLEHGDRLNIGIYIDMEQFRMMEIRDEYSNNISHMVNQMNVKYHICRNLSELKHREEYEKFTHIFVSLVEYKQDEQYFDELSKKTTVIVILYRSDEKELSNPQILRLYKPFYIIPILSLLNGQNIQKQEDYWKRTQKITAPNAHILVVDDNLTNLKLMEGILEKYQMKVSTATSGKNALEKIVNQTYDLVFMDHMMPEMDGVEALHLIRKKTGSYFKMVPIVVLTANAIAGAREMFLGEGFTDFLEKPVETSVLERVLIRNLPKEKVQYVKENIDIRDNTQKSINIEETKQEEKAEEIIIGDLDVEKGLTYCGGSENYIEVLKITCDTAKENQEKIKTFFEEKNWKDYTILVHGIKSTMLSIGADRLSKMSKDLEMAGKNEDVKFILENHENMLQEYNRVEQLLREYLHLEESDVPENEIEKLPEIDEESFEKAVADLDDAMDGFDEERMIKILENLKKYQYGGAALEKPIESVMRKVRMSDYMSAVETVAKLKNDLKKKVEGGDENV